MTNVRQFLVALTATTTLVAVWLLSSSVSSKPQTAVLPSTTRSSATAPASKREEDSALAHDIDQLIDESDAAQARFGVFVISMKDGRVLYSRNSDKLFTPASNLKIYTTAVALDLLGVDYRWRTSVYALKPPDNSGLIEGDLILYGRGAPDLDSKEKGGLPALVEQLYEHGVRRVRGNIVGDESYFRAEPYGVGWQWNDLQWYYGAEPSALSIDENSVEVTLGPANKMSAPAAVLIRPNDGYLHVTNEAITGERDAVTTIGINRSLSNNELRVWGEFPEGGRAFSAFLSVQNPALRAATIFRQLLNARGIHVDGEARSRDFRVADDKKLNPGSAVELASIESATLTDIVRKTNKQSNNLFAELILRTLGKERGAVAPDSDPRKNASRGDDVAGTAVVRKWLTDHSINAAPLAIQDGSGLSRLNLVTPESAARLLAVADHAVWNRSFRDSLPIAGRDGTLNGRLTNLSGRVAAKTGTLTYTHSLSGYATIANGEVLAFSILCNDAVGRGHPQRTIDAVTTRISGFTP